jgi:glycosyltransferase involved in cell wall biosynthesis
VLTERRLAPMALIEEQTATPPQWDVSVRLPRVSVVIPAMNEEKNLPYVLTRLPHDLHEVILVDGRSTDNTIEVARAIRPDIQVLRQSGRGKGNALQHGFEACTGDVIVMLDADGSTDAAEIPRFVTALCSGADFVKGSRFASGGGSADITRLRRLGNWGLSTLVNLLYGTRYSDLCYGYNAFWAYCLPHIDVDCDGFEVETLINIRCAKAGLTVHEVPSYEGHRVHGASNLNALRDGLRVFRTILLERRIGRGGRMPERPSVPKGFGWDGVERRGAGRQSNPAGAHSPTRTGRRASDRSIVSVTNRHPPRLV